MSVLVVMMLKLLSYSVTMTLVLRLDVMHTVATHHSDRNNLPKIDSSGVSMIIFPQRPQTPTPSVPRGSFALAASNISHFLAPQVL